MGGALGSAPGKAKINTRMSSSSPPPMFATSLKTQAPMAVLRYLTLGSLWCFSRGFSMEVIVPLGEGPVGNPGPDRDQE